jgi:16S rRNA (adenine1518-N6/adenine1519-N6)-dimethyltransferase
VDRTDVFAVIDAAFSQRRKMLRSALAGWAGGPEPAATILTSAGVPATARGEELTVEQFAAIATAGRHGRLAAVDRR